MQNRTTIKDVAALAQVSKSAVSTVLSPRSHNIRVAEKTRQRILDAAKKLSYQPNILAKSLTRSKSFLLGYYFGAYTWHIASKCIKEIEKVCHQNNYSLIVYPSSSLQEEQEHLQLGINRHLDGIIATPYISSEGDSNVETYSLIAKRIPVIQLVSHISDLFPLVSRDYMNIGYDAVKNLIRQGHRKIGLLVHSNYLNPVTGQSSYSIYQGYLRAMKEAKLEAAIFPGQSLDCNSTPEFMGDLSGKNELPSAFVADSNTLAYRAMAIFRENNMRVPEDISVISCADDIIFPDYVFPELTHYPVSFETIGKVATAKCLNLPGTDPANKLYFKQHLQEGLSVAPLKTEKT